eukprot:m.48183 g.48183  ORF g.48183 m.48183 type:complete len:441 (+) comp6020_c1_seq1:53-1375(+)
MGAAESTPLDRQYDHVAGHAPPEQLKALGQLFDAWKHENLLTIQSIVQSCPGFPEETAAIVLAGAHRFSMCGHTDRRSGLGQKEFVMMGISLSSDNLDDRGAFYVHLPETPTLSSLRQLVETLCATFFKTPASAVRTALIAYLVQALPRPASEIIEAADIATWLRACAAATLLFEYALAPLLGPSMHAPSTLSNSIIAAEQIHCLQSWLPLSYRPTPRRAWTLEYSSALHGASFSAFRGTLLKCGATIIIVRDRDGHVFGSFTSEAWALRATFAGTEPCFLFSLAPAIAHYRPTNFNKNFQYFSSGLTKYPTGLGLGGQLGFHGIWIDGAFGTGHCRGRPTCSTFGNPQLSMKEEFEIDLIEIWELSPRPDDGKGGKKKSVLDSNVEDQELLDMAGRALHSRDIRKADAAAAAAAAWVALRDAVTTQLLQHLQTFNTIST